VAGSAEPPSSSASEASGREGSSAVRGRTKPQDVAPVRPVFKTLPSSHKPGSVGVASRPAPVAREYRVLYSGTTTANGFDSRPLLGGRAREHRELNRRDNPSLGRSGRRMKSRPRRGKDGKRKPGRVHAWGRGAQCRFGKAPPSRSDRPPQGGRKRVGRGSLQRLLHRGRDSRTRMLHQSRSFELGCTGE